MKCQNCARQYFCDKKKCEFLSFIHTKNYGEVKRITEDKENKK